MLSAGLHASAGHEQLLDVGLLLLHGLLQVRLLLLRKWVTEAKVGGERKRWRVSLLCCEAHSATHAETDWEVFAKPDQEFTETG